MNYLQININVIQIQIYDLNISLTIFIKKEYIKFLSRVTLF